LHHTPTPTETPESIVAVNLSKPNLSDVDRETRAFLMTGDNAALAGRMAGGIGGDTGHTIWNNVLRFLEGADSAWEAFVNGFNHPND
jgi:hypothetical protein